MASSNSSSTSSNHKNVQHSSNSRRNGTSSNSLPSHTSTAYRIFIMTLSVIVVMPAQISSVDPKFDASTRMHLVLVPADAQVGSVIYRLRATDEEFDYPLTFELVGDASTATTVKIESLPCTKYNSVCQANVILQRRLEPGRYYSFQVSVKDTKGGMATQVCSITATNHTTPHDLIFPHKPTIIMIPEDAKRGTELDYVIARKNPHSQKPVYLELWGSPLFAIRQKIVPPDTTEGTLFLLRQLDFEKQAMYHLTILANDAYADTDQDGRNIAGLEIVVIVQDVQDQPPVFTIAPPVTKLPPGIFPGDKILQVHAEDGDKGNPREVRYGLVSEGNPFTSFFDINDTSGEIFLMRPLEDIAAITHVGDPVLLTVIAEEVKVVRDEPPAMASTVQLAFFLPERTNSPPYFENDHYVSRVDENAPQGIALTFIDPYVPRVYDDDTGKNGVFSLTLLNNNGTFEVSPNVAERSASFLIRVRDNMLLDYEERQSVEFQIFAQELGPATNLSAIVNVTVYINDVNDNPPIFSHPVYTVELPENMTVGTKVVQVEANDVDTGMGGRVRYTAILGYLNTSLNLDADTGLITISTNNHGFDREVMPEYHLYVEARDNDGTGNRAQVPLVIKMIDINDESPIFDKEIYEFILATDLQSFTAAAIIHAVDKDATAPNNEVRYEIINGNYENIFSLNKVTGELTVQEKILLRSKKNVRAKRQLFGGAGGGGGGGGVASTSGQPESDMFVLTARAYDLGVPVRFATATIRIYPPESRTRTVTFVVPGHDPDKQKTEETLSTITGGKVIIHEIRPLRPDESGGKNLARGSDIKERSVVTATVLYDGTSVVDISQIQQRLSQHNSSYAIMTRETIETDTLYKAENKLLFWLLIVLASLVALTILILLLCCICSWCPLYRAASKRIVNISRTEDDVHLVHREMANGKQTKSVQVAEWMGRREAWSAEKPPDPRTKPTRWEFYDGREQLDEGIIEGGGGGDVCGGGGGGGGGGCVAAAGGGCKTGRSSGIGDVQNKTNESAAIEKRRIRSADEHHRRVRIKNNRTAKDDTHLSFHNSRTNLISDRDVYIEDIVDEREIIEEGGDDDREDNNYQRSSSKRKQQKKRYIGEDQHVDDDSMRRHEIDRGSDIDYTTTGGRSSLKNKREYFIKDGNVEILQLMTRDKQREAVDTLRDDDNIYVNVPMKTGNLSHPQLLMVDNSGKEILMRRFIEEQPDGKQIIREHYQIVPGATYIQSMPNEVQQLHSILKDGGGGGAGDTFPLGKSGPNSVVYSQLEPEVKVIHTQPLQQHPEGFPGQMQPSNSNQSLTHELESSLRQQNELLRQILMEKEKLDIRYTQQEVALETQSLPGQSMAIATQTDCEAATQTDAEGDYVSRTSVGTTTNGNGGGTALRRRARSENDDSMSEDEYEYVRFSPPNSPEGVYWIKRKRQKKKGKHRGANQPRKRVVMVEEVKRKIRTPIKEEDDDEFYEHRKRSPPKKPLRYHGETKTSKLRRMKNEEAKRQKKIPNSDSLDGSPDEQRRHQIRVEQVDYYDRSGGEEDDPDYQDYPDDSDADEIVIKSNAFTPSLHDDNSPNHHHRFAIHVSDGSKTQNAIFSHSSSEQRDDRPDPKPRFSRQDEQKKRRNEPGLQQQHRITISKYQSPGPKVNGTAEIRNSKRILKDRTCHSETDLIEAQVDNESNTKGVPKYMEWYYGRKKPLDNRTSSESVKQSTTSSNKKKLLSGSEKRISKTRITSKSDEGFLHDDTKYKPEPAPRKSPQKGNRMLKEDVLMNRHHKPKIETDINHPLLQHSQHRYEREYDNASDLPLPPTKLPHYMYPETPPCSATAVSISNGKENRKHKPKPSPIKENEIKVTNSKINLYIEDSNVSHPSQPPPTTAAATATSQQQHQKQLNVSTLEDDHDSGIAMSSLLNSMGRRNPIAEKKSVFSIAYDDVSRVQKIQSGGESPQYS